MRIPARIFLLVSILLFSFIFLSSPPLPKIGPFGRVLRNPALAASPGEVVINEVYYDVAAPGVEYDNEWVELYNGTDSPIDISNWTLADNKCERVIPEATISAKGFALITNKESTWGFWSIPDGVVKIALGEKIGNGLSNSGDRLILRDDGGNEVDALSYGKDSTFLDPPCVDVKEGHSLERSSFGFDTDQASDFIEQGDPTPGAGFTPPVYSDQIFLNEIMPNPEGSDAEGEYLELYNAGDEDVDLEGWKVGDEKSAKIIGDGIELSSYLVPSGGFLVIYRKDSHIILNNDGDRVKLWNPNDEIVDEVSYPEINEGWVYQRYPDGEVGWSESNQPSAGAANKASSDSFSSSGPYITFTVEDSNLKVNQSFAVRLDIKNAKPLHDYYVKIRVGLSESKLTKGRTYSSFYDKWLADNASWSKFPVVYTTSDGTENITLSAKVGSGNPADTYCIGVRVCDRETGETYDSDLQTITVGEEDPEKVALDDGEVADGGAVLGATTELPATGANGLSLVSLGLVGGLALSFFNHLLCVLSNKRSPCE